MRYPVLKLTPYFYLYLLGTIFLFGYSFLQGFAEDLSQFPGESFDAVIETLVLCSVNNVEESLQEIQRVLKPGGLFCYLDHVKGPESTWLVTIQNFLTSTVSLF
jgi:ubiquinone/menaquinone biosynthesis C-methylase UbiE